MDEPPRWTISEDETSRIWIVLPVLIVVAVAAGAAYFLLRGSGDNSPTSSTAQTTTSSTGTRPVAVSASGLATLAAHTSYPIYWAGPRSSKLYEITQAPNGDISLRYLPKGAGAGYTGVVLSVGTYPFRDAYDSAKKTLETSNDNVAVPVGGDALAFRSKQSRTNVYVVFPDEDVQIEVFSPTPGQAQRIVEAGQIVAVK